MPFPKQLTQPANCSHADWLAEGKRRFGDDPLFWRFICPGCGHVAAAKDWKDVGAPETEVGFSCVGRYLPERRDWLTGEGPGPCNYAGFGLFRIHPIKVLFNDQEHGVFAFAEPTPPLNADQRLEVLVDQWSPALQAMADS